MRGFSLLIDSCKVRNLTLTTLRRDLTTEEAEAFLMLYGDQLKKKLNAVLKDFVTEKLGEK